MKRALSIILVLAIGLVGGCTYFTGVWVVFKPEASDSVRQDLHDFLLSKNYVMDAMQDREVFVYRSPDHLVHAVIVPKPEGLRFSVGKGGTSRKLLPDEIAEVDTFAIWLLDRSHSIMHGQASRAATTKPVRDRFHANVQRP
jgi:hypothetical protein